MPPDSDETAQSPTLDESVEPNPRKLFDMRERFAPITNLLGVGNPDVQKIGDRWWMFFGGFHTGCKNNLFSASLPAGAPLNSDPWTITAQMNKPRRAASLVAQPRRGSWDATGLHTPSYAVGAGMDASGQFYACERIYHAGRNSQSIIDNSKPISIGVLEKTPRGWARYPRPVLVGTSDFASVLEPKVRYLEGKWRMWYAATPRVAGKKTPPIYQIRYVESEDGITSWSQPQVLFSTDEGYFDAVVNPSTDGYEMVTCRSGNLSGASAFPVQGLWWLSSQAPSGNRKDWSHDPLPILEVDSAAADWYANGVLGPSAQYGDTDEDRNTMYVFFTGVSRETNWLRAARKAFARGSRPPFPAPFYLSIARAQFRRVRHDAGHATERAG